MKILLPASAQEEANRKKAIAVQKAKEANKKERRIFVISFLILLVLTLATTLNGPTWLAIGFAVLTAICAIRLMFFGADDHIDMIIETSELAAKAKANLNRKK